MRRLALILLSALVAAGCSSDDGAPPTEALGLREDVRVVGHAENCAGSVCTRHLLVGPGLEAGRRMSSTQALEAEIIRGLRASGWKVRNREPAYVADSNRHAARVTVVPTSGATGVDLTAPPLRTQLRTMLDAGQPVVAITLSPR